MSAAELAKAEAAVPAADGGLLGHLRTAHKYALLHHGLIVRWGRYPHRNAVLGRKDTPEEAAGLADKSIPRF